MVRDARQPVVQDEDHDVVAVRGDGQAQHRDVLPSVVVVEDGGVDAEKMGLCQSCHSPDQRGAVTMYCFPSYA